MRVRFGLPVWALLFSVPVALLAINLNAETVPTVDTEVVDANDMNVAADDLAVDTNSTDLSLEDGASDEWRRRGWGRGFGLGLGWGGYGYGGWGSWLNPYLYSPLYYPYYNWYY